jgi:hypothetical protein
VPGEAAEAFGVFERPIEPDLKVLRTRKQQPAGAAKHLHRSVLPGQPAREVLSHMMRAQATSRPARPIRAPGLFSGLPAGCERQNPSPGR